MAIHRAGDRLIGQRSLHQRSDDGGIVEPLRHVPRAAGGLRLGLQITAGQVIPGSVATDQRRRILKRHVNAATPQRHDQFGLVVQIGGLGREGDRRATFHHRIGGLGEEEGCLTGGIAAHFAAVFGIVAPHAEDATDRKAQIASRDWQRHRACGGKDRRHQPGPMVVHSTPRAARRRQAMSACSCVSPAKVAS